MKLLASSGLRAQFALRQRLAMHGYIEIRIGFRTG
jgi:hypothetical protein